MIARSRVVLALGLLVSVVVHLGAVALIWGETAVETTGGGPATETSIGVGFEDLSAGVQTPVVPAATAQETDANASAAIPPAENTAPTVATVPMETTPSVAAGTALPIQSDEAADIAIAPQDVQRGKAPSDTLSAQAPRAVVSALADTSLATTVSARPRMPRNRPKPPETRPAPAVAQTQGNASRNARAGAQGGSAKARSQPVEAAKAATPKASGNAQASTYPGLVMARLARVPRPRSTTRGAATVRFTISDIGQLSSVSVASPSGSAALDRAALAVVRRAQPFPRPPAGARRTYTVKIEGR